MSNTWVSLLVLCLFGALPLELRAAGDASHRLSERTYRQLATVHALMEKQHYDQALAALDRMRPRVQHKVYEHALVLQTYGYVFANTEQYERAVDALARSLALKALPRPATERSLYALAQLQMAVDDYQAAVVSLEKWFEAVETPTAEAHALAGTAYAQTHRYREAAIHLTKAIDLAGKPQENWYRQLLAVYYQAGDYLAAMTVLEQMIPQFPHHKDYWLQLSGVYLELGDDAQALAVMELAYIEGLLNEQSELITLARYFLYMGLPHKAGQLLEKALAEGSLTSVAGTWQLLIDAWLRARESDRALAASERALESTPHADLYLKRARLLADNQRWPEVIVAVERALASAGLSSPGQAHLLRGIAHYHLGQSAAARSSFGHAGEFADSADQARRWTSHLSASQSPVTPADTGYTTAYSSH